MDDYDLGTEELVVRLRFFRDVLTRIEAGTTTPASIASHALWGEANLFGPLRQKYIGPPKGPDGLEDVEGVQGGERQIDSHEPG